MSSDRGKRKFDEYYHICEKHYIDGLSHTAIHAKTGVSLPTLKKWNEYGNWDLQRKLRSTTTAEAVAILDAEIISGTVLLKDIVERSEKVAFGDYLAKLNKLRRTFSKEEDPFGAIIRATGDIKEFVTMRDNKNETKQVFKILTEFISWAKTKYR